MAKEQHKCSEETWMLRKSKVRLFASVFIDEETGENFMQESFRGTQWQSVQSESNSRRGQNDLIKAD